MLGQLLTLSEPCLLFVNREIMVSTLWSWGAVTDAKPKYQVHMRVSTLLKDSASLDPKTDLLILSMADFLPCTQWPDRKGIPVFIAPIRKGRRGQSEKLLAVQPWLYRLLVLLFLDDFTAAAAVPLIPLSPLEGL